MSFQRFIAKAPRLSRLREWKSFSTVATTPLNSSQPAHLDEEVTVEELRQRRSSFIQRLIGKAVDGPKHHVVLIPAASVLHSTYDVPFPFRQNSEFLYLTGSEEPDGVLLIHSDENSEKSKSVLFIHQSSDHKILWEGPSPSCLQTVLDTGVEESLNLDQLQPYLTSTVGQMGGGNHIKLWLDYQRIPVSEDSSDNSYRQRLSSFLRVNSELTKFSSPLPELHQTRWKKSPAEQNRMRRAGQIGAASLESTMKFSMNRLRERQSQGLKGVEEHTLLAKMDFESRLRGAQKGLSYPPVIAGGNRANTIHYLKPYEVIQESEMVLMDAGCEYRSYVSDITRTWPVSGSFTPEQRMLYEIVLDVQETVLRCLSNEPSLTLADLYHIMLLRLGQDLVGCGILPDNFNSDEDMMRAAGEFCPHHVGHYLGIDVHDVDRVSKDIPLESGVAITVEPGLYFRRNDERVPAKYRGIGIRIEDDVLITDSGTEVLTAGVPKGVQDIINLSQRV